MEICVWEIESGKKKLVLSDFYEPICVTRNAKFFIGKISFKNDFIIWDLETGQQITTLHVEHKSDAVMMTQDGEWAIFTDFNKISVWNLTSKRELHQFDRHKCGINSLELSSDEKMVISTSYDKKIIWNLESGVVFHEFSEPNIPDTLLDGKRFVSFDKDCINILDISTGKVIKKLVGFSQSNFTGASGKWLVFATDNLFTLWNHETGREYHCIPRSLPNNRTSPYKTFYRVSPNGKWLLIVTWIYDLYSHTLEIWEIQSERLIARFTGDSCFTNYIITDNLDIILGSMLGSVYILHCESRKS